MKKKNFIIPVILFLILTATTIAYLNHFKNPFHFDDSHTIENNIYIKNLKNTPGFFKNASTFSSLPQNQTYRPLVTTTLAIDYHIAKKFYPTIEKHYQKKYEAHKKLQKEKSFAEYLTSKGLNKNEPGLSPLFYHISMFFWFLVQLLLMFLLFRKILNTALKHAWSDYFALFAVAWYGLHTANAETINYVISRSDSLSTLCVVAALYIYIAFPKKRIWGIYLVPFIMGMFIKEQAAMFVPLLFSYIIIFETKLSLSDIFKTKNFKIVSKAIINVLPALLIGLVLGFVVIAMQTKTFTTGNISRFDYFITQPWVYFRYVFAFFLPFNLSADTDWKAFTSIFDERVWAGFAVIVLLFVATFKTSKKPETKPMAFGILWFFFALLPTSSLIPLSEVTNDHRMFFPFVGLVLSVTIGFALILIKYEKHIKKKFIYKIAFATIAVFILAANAYGVYQRNKVWSSAESLWFDVTIKSPSNGRGLMNYGLSQMRKGNYTVALDYFNRALVYVPYYSYLHVNLAIAKNAIGQAGEAEEHFRKALQYGSKNNEVYYFYAKFLFDKGRNAEALQNAEIAFELSKAHMPTRHLLLNLYLITKNADKFDFILKNTIKEFPNDTYSKSLINANITPGLSELEIAENNAKSNPTANNYLNLGLAYYNHKQFDKCIEASEQVLKLEPNNAVAYNNICSAYNELKEWDKAIEACNKAIALKPDFTLAKNNLNLAKSKKLSE